MGAERATKQSRREAEPAGSEQPLVDFVESTRRGLVSEALADERVSRSIAPVAPATGSRIQPKLEVGAADDPYEREADETADAVMKKVAPGASDFAPPPMGRVARQAEVGADGGAISTDLERSISSSSGSAMPDDVRSQMESGFGTDFSGVRVHADSPSASKIQARAFTHGSDIHFAPGQFQPDSPGGQHLLAHELTHVVQQTGTVSRLMWEQPDFDKQTSETFTTKSTAQKEIRAMLVGYNTKYPYGVLEEAKAKEAFDVVTRMKFIADAYLAKNVKEVAGEKIERSSRSNRIKGMQLFATTCDGELGRLKYQLNRGKDEQSQFDDATATQRVTQEAGMTKIKDHYEGDAVSCFRKLGGLIEAAVPMAGDSAEISLEVKIPVHPGVTVNLGFGAEAERGDAEAKYRMPGAPPPTPGKVSPVEVALNVSAGVGGNIGSAAEVAGALGAYIQSRAQTGADAAELLSYALFRRGRSAKAVPREVVNFMWGEGNADAFGWQVAEAWSLGVEKRLLDTPTGTDANGDPIENENFVETGGYGAVTAEIGIKEIAKVELEAKAYQGTRIDAESLKARKGGAGKANKTSGKTTGPLAKGGKDMLKQGDRGATQKDVGRTTRGFSLSASAGNDMLSGGLEFAMRWMSDGAHGKKSYKLNEATIGGNFSFTMPGDQIVGGGIGNMIPPLIESINRMIGNAKMKAAKEEGATPRTLGNVGNSLDSAATSIALLAKAEESFAPPTKLAEDSAGFSSSTAYTVGVEFDLLKKELSITISQDKSSEAAKLLEHMSSTAGGAVGVKLEMSKSSRLLEIGFDGTKWGLKWAGGEYGG